MSTAVVVESRELPPLLTAEQQVYLQKIRAEEREIADERRRESWARLLTRYNGSERHDDDDRDAGVATALAPDSATKSIQNEIAAEVTHWQDRSARLATELTRADAERLVAVLKVAESDAYAEEAQRAAAAEREERRLATEREATAHAARVEAEARAEEERLAALALSRANVEIAEEEQQAALAKAKAEAGEERRAALAKAKAESEQEREAALAEVKADAQRERQAALAKAKADAEEERLAAVSKAKAESEKKRQSALAQAKADAEQERQTALIKAKAEAEEARRAESLQNDKRTRVSEEERRAALMLAEAKAEAEEARRAELHERDERLRTVVEERQAALALAAEAEAETNLARLAQAREREERVLAEERERTAAAVFAETQALAEKARRAQRLQQDRRARAAEEQRAIVTTRAEAAAYRENRRRERSSGPASNTQPYSSPRLSRMAGLPPMAAPGGVVTASVRVETALSPTESAMLPAANGAATTRETVMVPRPVAPVAQDVLQGATVAIGEAAQSRLAPLYAGTPAPAGAATTKQAALVLPSNLRARRGELLQRGILPASTSLSGWRRIVAYALGTLGVLTAGLFATGNAGRAGVTVSSLIERSPLPGWVLSQAQPSSLGGPDIGSDPGLNEYPGATAVVASVAGAFTNDLATLALNLDVASGPPPTWMTAEYLVRPTSYVEVGEYFRRLGEYGEDGPKLMPSLAEADIAFRAGFDAAGLTSESLAQQALSVYVGLQSAWNDHLAAQRAFALAGSDFDQFLRAEEGSLTFMLGEFGHRSAALASEATTMESNLQRALDRMNVSQAVVTARMIDLGAVTP